MATSSAITDVLRSFGISQLKVEQREILDCLLTRKNCVAVLPTGYGKSLPFQMFIPLQRALGKPTSTMLVCCPLISLMQDQVEKLTEIENVTAAYKGFNEETDCRIKDGLVDLLYASPETLVGDPVWRTDIQKLHVEVIVIDEFHTIATWGEDKDGTQRQAFRKWFSNLGELRSLFPEATLLALSATCTTKIKNRVMSILELGKEIVQITKSPNKSNIKVISSKIANTVDKAMSWIIDDLDEKKEEFPRCIIYCSSIKDASKIYTYVTKELPHCEQFVDMYHSETTKQKKKTEIVTKLKENSNLRVVISTSALGMGIDVQNCNCVILYGPPNNVIDLVQEIGRAGRQGQESLALMLYNSYHLAQTDLEVKKILKTAECRRLEMLGYFLGESELNKLKAEENGKHSCCDICATKCECGTCHILPMERSFIGSSTDSEQEHLSSDSEKTENYELSEYEYEDDIDMLLLQIPDDR